MKTRILGLMAASLLVGPMAASASMIGGAYNFTASGFGIGAPYDTVTGSFSVTFDNSGPVPDSVAGFSLLSLSLAGMGGAGYTYNPVGDVLTVGGLVNGVFVINNSTFDWLFSFRNFSTDPQFLFSAYTVATRVSYFSNSGTISQVTTVPVPEPASLALLGLGLAGLGVSRRRRATQAIRAGRKKPDAWSSGCKLSTYPTGRTSSPL